MANPNIVNVATINGKTDVFALTTSSANLVTATANTVFKTIYRNNNCDSPNKNAPTEETAFHSANFAISTSSEVSLIL